VFRASASRRIFSSTRSFLRFRLTTTSRWYLGVNQIPGCQSQVPRVPRLLEYPRRGGTRECAGAAGSGVSRRLRTCPPAARPSAPTPHRPPLRHDGPGSILLSGHRGGEFPHCSGIPNCTARVSVRNASSCAESQPSATLCRGGCSASEAPVICWTRRRSSAA
jgi:hypothetical protein